ncbi:MAG: hypothetical protein ABI721_03100 [Candidatus Dojkabacteria bacterium]
MIQNLQTRLTHTEVPRDDFGKIRLVLQALNHPDSMTVEEIAALAYFAKMGLRAVVEDKAVNSSPEIKESVAYDSEPGFSNDLVPELLQVIILQKLRESNINGRYDELENHLKNNWEEVLRAAALKDPMKVLIAIDKIANGYPDIKIILVDVIIGYLGKSERFREIQSVLEKFSNVNGYISDQLMNQEAVFNPNLSEREELAKNFMLSRGKGVFVAENVTPLNIGSSSTESMPNVIPTNILHVDGTLVREVARLLGYYRGDFFTLIQDMKASWNNVFDEARSPEILVVIVSILKYIYLLGNNYVEHDYTNASSVEVAKLKQADHSRIKFIEGVVLCQAIFPGDIISLPIDIDISKLQSNYSSTEMMIDQYAGDIMVAGGIRYTFDEQNTLRSQSVSLDALHDSYETLSNTSSKSTQSLLKFALKGIEFLEEADVNNLREVWGVNILEFKDGKVIAKDEKKLSKLRKFFEKCFFDQNALNVYVNGEYSETQVNTVLDPRYLLVLEFLEERPISGEIGRYVKLEDFQARDGRFPGMSTSGSFLELELVNFIRTVNKLINRGEKEIPMTSAFIQPDSSLLAQVTRTFPILVDETQEGIFVQSVIKPQAKDNKVAAAMGGYFGSAVGDVLYINKKWLIKKTLESKDLNEGIATLIAKIAKNNNLDLSRDREEVVTILWSTKKTDLLDLMKTVEA